MFTGRLSSPCPSNQAVITDATVSARNGLLLLSRRVAVVRQLTATGQTNLRYVFEASTDLAQWTKIAVRTNVTGTVDLTPSAASSPQRFYRVQVP